MGHYTGRFLQRRPGHRNDRPRAGLRRGSAGPLTASSDDDAGRRLEGRACLVLVASRLHTYYPCSLNMVTFALERRRSQTRDGASFMSICDTRAVREFLEVAGKSKGQLSGAVFCVLVYGETSLKRMNYVTS